MIWCLPSTYICIYIYQCALHSLIGAQSKGKYTTIRINHSYFMHLSLQCTMHFIRLNVRSTASTNTSKTWNTLSIQSDAITHSSNSISEDHNACTHQMCMNSSFCGLHSSFMYTYVADHSHWMHLFAGLLLHCQDSILDESEDQKWNHSRGSLTAGTPLWSKDR